MEDVCKQIQRAAELGKSFNIIVVAEGVKRIDGSQNSESPLCRLAAILNGNLALKLGSPFWAIFSAAVRPLCGTAY